MNTHTGRVTLLIGSFAVALLQADIALACSCPRLTPAEQFASSALVFRGTVRRTVDRVTPWRRAWSFLQTLVDSDRAFEMDDYAKSQGFKVEFDVDRTWRGRPSRRVAVFTGRGGGDCGVPFEVGRQYLVYAHCHQNGDCFTIICSRTQEIEDAAEDLRYLASRPPIR